MNTKTKIAVGILGAVATGVVIGLLLAPDKGAETRKSLKKTAGGWVDSLAHLFQKGKEDLLDMNEKVKQGKAYAEDKVNKIKETMG